MNKLHELFLLKSFQLPPPWEGKYSTLIINLITSMLTIFVLQKK